MHSQVSALHILMVLSWDPVMMRAPSGLQATEVSQPSWPLQTTSLIPRGFMRACGGSWLVSLSACLSAWLVSLLKNSAVDNWKGGHPCFPFECCCASTRIGERQGDEGVHVSATFRQF